MPVVEDQDLVEERLVELTAEFAGSSDVGLMTVGNKPERRPDVTSDGVEAEAYRGEQVLGLSELGGDAVLFGLEHVEGHGRRVVGLHELELLRLEALDPSLLADLLGVSVATTFREPVEERVVRTHRRLTVELDSGVVVHDRRLDVVDQHGTLVARGSLGLPPDTDEVRIDGAVSVLDVGDDESAAALPTPH